MTVLTVHSECFAAALLQREAVVLTCSAASWSAARHCCIEKSGAGYDTIAQLQVWLYIESDAEEMLDRLVRTAHRSLLQDHFQACFDIIKCLRPFALTLYPALGEP